MAKVTVEVTASVLNYRSGPGTSHRSLGTLAKGAKHDSSKQSINSGTTWYFIDKVNGWASGKYLKVTAKPTTAKTNTSKPKTSLASAPV